MSCLARALRNPWSHVVRLATAVGNAAFRETNRTDIAVRQIATLDTALGGDWWQQHFQDGVTDDAVMDVVAGFEARLGEVRTYTAAAAGGCAFSDEGRRAISPRPPRCHS